MKQLSILIALIMMISAGVQAKKYKVFYLGGQEVWEGEIQKSKLNGQ